MTLSVEGLREASIKLLLRHEGGYVNHPSDPGGPTNYGITIHDYRRYVKVDATATDIRNMRLEEAVRIYRVKYWDALRCSEFEPGVNYALFDYGVNSGIGRAGRIIRRIVKLPDNTSIVTDQVITTANTWRAVDLIDAICNERLRFLKSLKTWPVFGKGWGRRVTEVRAYALSIAADLPLVVSPSIVPSPGRAIDPDKFARIRALQQHLVAAGYDPGAIDGDLGPKTIRAFQKSRGLVPDAIVGPKTRPLLDAALAGIAPAFN